MTLRCEFTTLSPFGDATSSLMPACPEVTQKEVTGGTRVSFTPWLFSYLGQISCLSFPLGADEKVCLDLSSLITFLYGLWGWVQGSVSITTMLRRYSLFIHRPSGGEPGQPWGEVMT